MRVHLFDTVDVKCINGLQQLLLLPEGINVVQVTPGASPYGHDAFDKHEFEGTGPINNHNRAGSGDDRNLDVVRLVIDELAESGR